MGVPLEIVNDGEVSALAGSMSMEENAVLGIAMGSSLAAGYVTPHGNITNWLDELAFAPIDYNPQAPVDEWSGDRGVGALYMSQQCVFRLAPKVGIDIPPELSLARQAQIRPGAAGGRGRPARHRSGRPSGSTWATRSPTTPASTSSSTC